MGRPRTLENMTVPRAVAETPYWKSSKPRVRDFFVQQLRTRRRRNPEVWHKANRMVSGAILLALVLFVLAAFYPEWARYNSLATELDEKRAILQTQELDRDQREREVHLLQNDPEYVEIIARDKIGVMKPDEQIFRLDAPATTESTAVRAAVPVVP
jgi:cell division protein FtsB